MMEFITSRYYDLVFCFSWGLAACASAWLAYGRGRYSSARVLGALILFALSVFVFYKAITHEYWLGLEKGKQIWQMECGVYKMDKII